MGDERRWACMSDAVAGQERPRPSYRPWRRPAGILGLSPGFKFEPEDEEIVELFLLPRLHGDPLPLEGIFLDADPRSAPPWDLFARNTSGFFFAPGDEANQRKKPRTCVGGGTWVGQKLEKKEELRLRLSGGEDETVVCWQKYRYNFHRGSGRTGSTGWVMLEYTIAEPSDYNSFKVCRITFTGHGQKRKRVPDSDDQLATSAPSSIATGYQDHSAGAARACDQEPFLTQQETDSWTDQQEPAFPMQQQLVDQEQQAMGHASTTLPFGQESGMLVHMDQESGILEQFVSEQFTMPLQMDQETSFPVNFAGYGTAPLPVYQESSMWGQFVEYGPTPLTPDQQFISMPEQSIDFEDPATQVILEWFAD
ncbi:hypothetical protein BRADI_3g10414v3 [Brachypodium distachyon]|uniref:NAC domain-containing protein n=1 Tax=Brachypodium distachyon TaxID=15368 RepID=A0A0Q3F861_BRADI|nr:hypothetical protein BRADI_3g10414v3 [Brachypodium distachyon]